jgi:hypothetical protein
MIKELLKDLRAIPLAEWGYPLVMLTTTYWLGVLGYWWALPLNGISMALACYIFYLNGKKKALEKAQVEPTRRTHPVRRVNNNR